MKKTLIALTLSVAFVSCNNGGGDMTAFKKENDSLRAELGKLSGNSMKSVPGPEGLNTDLIDSSNAVNFILNWENNHAQNFSGICAFLVPKADLLDAMQRFPNAPSYIFYIGCTNPETAQTDSLKLIWQPADTTTVNDTLRYVADYVIRLGGGNQIRQVYDRTDPCPTCDLSSALGGIHFRKPSGKQRK